RAAVLDRKGQQQLASNDGAIIIHRFHRTALEIKRGEPPKGPIVGGREDEKGNVTAALLCPDDVGPL
ncbi:hypothetical protein GWI33_001032, partial [Rhynchophorus ferrugineus]